MAAIGPDILAAFQQTNEPGSEWPLNATSPVYENVRQVQSGSGYVYGFSVYSSAAAPQFILVFDTGSRPADGDTAACVFRIENAANLGVNWIPARWFARGCWICNSSTAPTLTIGTADCFFDAQYV